MLDDLRQDVRVAWRRLWTAPGFAIIAILTLALGIAANTTIFTLLNALVLRDLAVRDPKELAQLSIVMRSGAEVGLSFPGFQQIARDSHDLFSALVAWTGGVRMANVNGEPVRANVWMVSGNFHSELASTPAVGRLLVAADANLESLSGETVAVLGYEFWQRRYGGDPTVIGRTVQVEGVPFTIVGVTPRAFRGVSRTAEPEITIPITARQQIVWNDPSFWTQGNVFWVNVFGRRRPGISIEQVRARLTAAWPGVLMATMPASFAGVRRANFLAIRLVVDSVVEPGERLLRRQFERPLIAVMGIALCVLLITCVNLASLMLARTMKRGHEIGVQRALGASRWRAARQVLTEGLVVSAAGGLCGIAAAPALSGALAQMVLADRLGAPASLVTRPDVRILAVTTVLTVGATLLFSAVPAWVAARRETLALLQSGGRTLAGSGRFGRALVASQIALCLVVLVDAGLLVRTLLALRSVSPGFATSDVSGATLLPRLGTASSDYDPAHLSALLGAVAARPGVQSVSASWYLPGSGAAPLEFVAAPSAPGAEEIASAYNAVSPDFFRLLQIPLLRGRAFASSDDADAEPVTIVSHSLARRLFGDADAIGQDIRIGVFPHRQRVRVVGIAGDARLYDIKSSNVYTAYMPYAQDPQGYGTTLILRGTGISAADLTRTIASLGREFVATFEPLERVRDRAIVQERVTALLAEFFGGLGLLLAAIGVYGLMSYDVEERTRELGIRVALGATPGRILAVVLRRGSVMIAAGIAAGLGGGWAAARLVASLLFGVAHHDPVTLVAATCAVAAAATFACVLPARRAARSDAIVALRHD